MGLRIFVRLRTRSAPTCGFCCTTYGQMKTNNFGVWYLHRSRYGQNKTIVFFRRSMVALLSRGHVRKNIFRYNCQYSTCYKISFGLVNFQNWLATTSYKLCSERLCLLPCELKQTCLESVGGISQKRENRQPATTSIASDFPKVPVHSEQHWDSYCCCTPINETSHNPWPAANSRPLWHAKGFNNQIVRWLNYWPSERMLPTCNTWARLRFHHQPSSVAIHRWALQRPPEWHKKMG